MKSVVLVFVIIFSLNPSLTFCGTFNDTKTLLANLLKDYDTNVRPVWNQSQPCYVSVQSYIKSIQEFDEVKEMFSYVGALLVMWHDLNMMWDPAQYGGIFQVTVSYNDVWIPELILSSPSDDVDSLGKKWNRIKFYSNGYATWLPVDLIKSTCAVNVQNYPFDSQSCLVSFNAINYGFDELVIVPMSAKIDTTIYQENSLWDIEDTNAVAIATDGGYQADFTFHLKRKPSFVIINVILPILFLSMLNVFVFLLVPESGERASYCITVLLSIAVFMTIVSDMLPRSSQPVPIISYKLMVDMIVSSLIVFVTIVNLRLYSKDNSDPVPNWLKTLYKITTCQWRDKRKIQNGENSLKVYAPKADGDKGLEKDTNKINSIKNIDVKPFNMNQNEDVQRKLSMMIPLTEEILKRNRITWKKISFMFDWIALIFFTFVSMTSFVTFMAVTALNKD